MDGGVEARNLISTALHQMTAPPPKLKKERKKELAAKAIERPNTIWISRRNPPLVSPNARVRPVTLLMMTAPVFAPAPSLNSRIDGSGASRGHGAGRESRGKGKEVQKR